MKHQLSTSIEIDAPVEVVWDVLTDLNGYAEWNPFIVSSTGEVAVGERLTNVMSPPGGRTMKFRPVVTDVQHEAVFEWLGRLGVRGIFDGRHCFELEPTPSGTRLVHSESFSGVAVRALRAGLDTNTLAGFEAMNLAIKAHAEARTPCGS
ncbi:MAG: SRPBCC domain-containing protein [Actinomycetia bacterium]|nr:SRPBCC domain-containing protein [Actinomycetes bacterium]